MNPRNTGSSSFNREKISRHPFNRRNRRSISLRGLYASRSYCQGSASPHRCTGDRERSPPVAQAPTLLKIEDLKLPPKWEIEEGSGTGRKQRKRRETCRRSPGVRQPEPRLLDTRNGRKLSAEPGLAFPWVIGTIPLKFCNRRKRAKVQGRFRGQGQAASPFVRQPGSLPSITPFSRRSRR